MHLLDSSHCIGHSIHMRICNMQGSLHYGTTAVQRPTCCVVQVCGELVQRLIPGLSLMSPNPFLAAELWYLLELLPYSKRFEVYEDVSVRLLSQNSFENSMTVNLGSSKTAILLTNTS